MAIALALIGGAGFLAFGVCVWRNAFGLGDAFQSLSASMPGFRSYYSEMDEARYRRMIGGGWIAGGLIFLAVGLTEVAHRL